MKARIKATGEIIEISNDSQIYAENFDKTFAINELDIINDAQEEIMPLERPVGYWDDLRNYFAGMALQAILSRPVPRRQVDYARLAIAYADDLVCKLKEEKQ